VNNIFLIARKELRSFFASPVAYVIYCVLFIFLGIVFYAGISQAVTQQIAPTIQIIVGPLVIFLLFTAPAITMRALAEEQRNGTLEILLTAPVRDWEVVIGKWLGGMAYIVIILAVTWIYPIILNIVTQPGIDQGLLVSNYLGLVLLLGSFLAIGVWISSLFNNPIAAFFATLGVLLVLWMIGYPASVMGPTGGDFLRYIDITEHFYNSFYRGILELKDVIYYLSLIVLGLFLGSISVEARRWR